MTVRRAAAAISATVVLPNPDDGWAVYARLSAKKVGRKNKRRNDSDTVERQVRHIIAWAKGEGIPINPEFIYLENGVSAWKPGGKRPVFDGMLNTARQGAFPGIAVYKLDRFTRRTADALAFIDLAEKHHVQIDGPQSGKYDLSTPDGREKLRADASKAEHESDVISTRVKGWLNDHRGPDGLQLGPGRTFGFEKLSEAREFDDDLAPIYRDSEIVVVREMADRHLHKGETWAALAVDLNNRGITTARGYPWQGTTLGRMMAHPRWGGYNVAKDGKFLGMLPGEPVLDPETYAELQASFAKRRRGRPRTTSYPLSGIIECGRCPGKYLVGGARGTKRRYADDEDGRRYIHAHSTGGCTQSHKASTLEAYVMRKVIEASADPDTRARVNAADVAQDLARGQLHHQLDEADAELERLNGELSALEIRRIEKREDREADRQYNDMKAALTRMIAREAASREDLEAQLSVVDSTPPMLPPITEAEWTEATNAEREAIVKSLHLRIVLNPGVLGRKTFDPNRIVITSTAAAA